MALNLSASGHIPWPVKPQSGIAQAPQYQFHPPVVLFLRRAEYENVIYIDHHSLCAVQDVTDHELKDL